MTITIDIEHRGAHRTIIINHKSVCKLSTVEIGDYVAKQLLNMTDMFQELDKLLLQRTEQEHG